MEEINEGIVHATTIVDFNTWPDKQNSTDFGDAEVQALVEHFTPVLQEAGADPSKITDKWTALKAALYVSLDGCNTS